MIFKKRTGLYYINHIKNKKMYAAISTSILKTYMQLYHSIKQLNEKNNNF